MNLIKSWNNHNKNNGWNNSTVILSSNNIYQSDNDNDNNSNIDGKDKNYNDLESSHNGLIEDSAGKLSRTK